MFLSQNRAPIPQNRLVNKTEGFILVGEAAAPKVSRDYNKGIAMLDAEYTRVGQVLGERKKVENDALEESLQAWQSGDVSVINAVVVHDSTHVPSHQKEAHPVVNHEHNDMVKDDDKVDEVIDDSGSKVHDARDMVESRVTGENQVNNQEVAIDKDKNIVPGDVSLERGSNIRVTDQPIEKDIGENTNKDASLGTTTVEGSDPNYTGLDNLDVMCDDVYQRQLKELDYANFLTDSLMPTAPASNASATMTTQDPAEVNHSTPKLNSFADVGCDEDSIYMDANENGRINDSTDSDATITADSQGESSKNGTDKDMEANEKEKEFNGFSPKVVLFYIYHSFV